MLLLLVASALLGGSLGAHPRLLKPRLDGRIVGGSPVNITDFPYQLSFLYNGRHICGASIISKNYVVTAAHCADGSKPSSVQFRAGSSIRGSGGFVRDAEKIVTHPKYNSYTIDYDIAVVRVAQPFPLEEKGVAAVALAASTPAKGSNIVVSGWGTLRESGALPSQLQAVQLQVVDHEQCDRAYQQYGGVTARMLCAGVPGGGKDACQGDSGGPLVAGGRLVGVVSWGIGCARPAYPGVNTDVASVRDWVAQQAGI